MIFKLRREWFVSAFLILLPLAVFFDLAAGWSGLYIRDLARFHYPLKQIFREVVVSGEFPEWNRFSAGGQPLAANPQHEVFYPLNWLVLFGDFHRGFHLQILLHISLSLVGMYAFLRSLELGRAASLIGALSWGMGGAYLSYTNLLPFLYSIAWLPLIALYARRFIERLEIRAFVFAALAFAMQMLVGEPTTIIQTALLLGAYAIYHALKSASPKRDMRRSVLAIGALVVTAVLAGAVQILPMIDLAGDSIRARSFSFELVSTWSMPWAKLLEWFFPNVLGHISLDGTMQYWGGALYPRSGVPFIFCLYSGVLVPIAAYAGFRGGGRAAFLVAAIGLGSILLAAGEHTPLLRLLYATGIAQSLRYPEKFVLMLAFALISFSAIVLDRVLNGDETARLRMLHAAIAVAIVGAAAALMTAGLARRDWILVLVRAAGAAGLLFMLDRMRRRSWVALAVAFVLADLLPVGQQINPRMPREYFDPSPLAAALPPQRDQYRLFHAADWMARPDAARYFPATQLEWREKFSMAGAANYWILRNGLFPMLPASAGIEMAMERDYDRTYLLPTHDFNDATWLVARHRPELLSGTLMAMSNAWFTTRYRDFDRELMRSGGDLTQAIPVDAFAGPRMPRYYFAGALVPIGTPLDFARHLLTRPWPENVAFARHPPFAPARGEVLRVHETDNSATLDVRASGRAFLVMSVTPHKYWKIEANGRRVPPIVTNLGYQGIELPAGTHRVVMRYRNPLLRVGGLITAVSFLALVAVAFIKRRAESSAPESSEFRAR